MSQEDCAFLETVKRKQCRFWLAFFIWWVCAAAFVFVVNQFFKGISDAVVLATFYVSAMLLYLPAWDLYRAACPYCHGKVGALPFLRYKFIYCRACGERIECNHAHLQHG
ncbi:hypothetical protein [Dyella sp. C9]|uniref:hypothetical protein n=1 Tax=Dyella sp. C9 TaxID=2202154 RepID=UPI001E380A74|nr:hypothetical protein [Dyella sp. C9]